MFQAALNKMRCARLCLLRAKFPCTARRSFLHTSIDWDYYTGEDNAGSVVAFGKFFFASPARTQKLSNPAFRVLVFPNIPLSPMQRESHGELKRTFDLTSTAKRPWQIMYEEGDYMHTFNRDHLGAEITYDDWDDRWPEERLKRKFPWVLHIALKAGTEPSHNFVSISG